MPISSPLRFAALAALCSSFVACSKSPEIRPAPIPDVATHASESGWGNPEVDKGGIPGIDYARSIATPPGNSGPPKRDR